VQVPSSSTCSMRSLVLKFRRTETILMVDVLDNLVLLPLWSYGYSGFFYCDVSTIAVMQAMLI
jgi:hypothetical protein